MDDKTIVALATPIGRSAVAVIRMSGADSIDIAKKLFRPFPTTPNMLQVGKLTTPNFVEQAMCVYFVAPKSYTGENSVEFHCHGGMEIVRAIIDECIDKGARMALNGEFSKRAFINGKQNLSNAEGIIEMIDAETQTAVKAGENLLNNRLGQMTVSLQDTLTDLISSTEAALDYPEEDLELPTIDKIQTSVKAIDGQLVELLNTVSVGKIVKYGINIAIVGRPNVGKSSLLNAFLGTDRAIVSDIAGTTRDTLNESVQYRDTKFNFVDTAGLRNADNAIEAEGIRRAQKAIDDSDIVLWVTDGTSNDLSYKVDKPCIKVYNKSDIVEYKGLKLAKNAVKVSAKQNVGIEELKQKIYDMFAAKGPTIQNGIVLTNARHIDCLTNAHKVLQQILAECTTSSMDILAASLREAWQILGEITGTTADEAIIDRIYSKFCLGK